MNEIGPATSCHCMQHAEYTVSTGVYNCEHCMHKHVLKNVSTLVDKLPLCTQIELCNFFYTVHMNIYVVPKNHTARTCINIEVHVCNLENRLLSLVPES